MLQDNNSWLMFAGGIDVALAYRTLVAIIKDSLSKRAIKVVNRAEVTAVNNDGLSGNP